jgi:UDP-N-acetylmuramoyl-tripeptide--D-alanyl-D-alanine ligase
MMWGPFLFFVMLSTTQLYTYYRQYPEVITDTRKVIKDGLFFALKGARFDGNQFAQKALDQGAAFAIVDDPEVAVNEHFLLVENVLESLQSLANYHRRQLAIPVLGITGSNGKTTTKELVGSVLARKYRLHFTQGNLNNHIGVPLTLLSMPFDVEMAVIEMGANHQGEIDLLSRIAAPDFGLITNIGKAHLEGFGGIEGVKKGKSELYRYIGENGTVFINRDERFLEDLAKNNPKKIFYQSSQTPKGDDPDTYYIQLSKEEPFLEATFLDASKKSWTLRSNLVGIYNFNNIMTAVAIGKYFEVEPSDIKAAIEAYVPSNNRSQLLQQGSNQIVLDAYNANPTSMLFALQMFAKMEAKQRVAILGDMLELGEDSEKEHTQILNEALQLPIEQLVLVGKEFGKIDRPDQVLYFPDAASAKNWFENQSFEQTAIFIKGSRGIGLEKILEA